MKDSYDGNDALLNLIHEALKKWKRAENVVEQEDGSYVLNNRNKIRSEALKNIYLELLKEAKNRECTLTKEQLLERIVYSGKEKKFNFKE